MNAIIGWVAFIGLIAVCLIGSALKPNHSEGALGKSIAVLAVVLMLALALLGVI